MRRFGVLLGFLLKVEADAIFRQQPYETIDGSDPLELWRQFEGKRVELPPLERSARSFTEFTKHFDPCDQRKTDL